MTAEAEINASAALDGKLERLRGSLAELGEAIVAFSGGVDSSFLLRVAREVLDRRAIALTTVSPTNPDEDTSDAIELAREWDVEHVVVHANELEIPGYQANPVNRCYFCKTNLYEIAEAEAERRGIRWIVDGVNLDDLGDYRPGLKAASEHRIRHPLADAELSKAEIREASRRLGLRTWDRPASPCLSSRFPYGTPITPEGLDRVSRAEKALHARGFRECRVRFHERLARIEVPLGDLPRLLEPAMREGVTRELREIGFRFVTIDLEGFRSGSLNRDLPSDLRKP
jgi:pyridinium-3,5-biscarboxylic acid mononucleotide sulfurtransferase